MKTLHTQFQLKWTSSVPMKTRFRNSANSISGVRTRGSSMRNSAIAARPASTLTTTSGEPQPLWPLVCTPSTTSTSPTVSITKPRRSKRRGAEGHVHEEEPAPAELFREHAADERPQRLADRAGGRPDADRLAALGRRE